MCKLDGILEESKEYDQLKKKLENRRLDFDAKLNQVQKAKKETPQLEEATRVAQAKYEETMTALTNKMIEINSTEVQLSFYPEKCHEKHLVTNYNVCDKQEDQLQGLLGMLEFELKYHESCVAILKTVCADLSG